MNHREDLDYEGGLEKLANDLCDLQYDSLAKFFGLVSEKLKQDAAKDAEKGRNKLAFQLFNASAHAQCLEVSLSEAWKVCKKSVKKAAPCRSSPLNDVCEKCGRVYCDHENKY